jgi:hypothetical protein
MKKVTLLLIFICLILKNGLSQIDSLEDHSKFVFITEFYPSFILPCRITLKKEDNNYNLLIDQIYDRKHFKLSNISNLKMQSTDSLLIDRGYRQFYPDSVFIKHLEKAEISRTDFQKFSSWLTTQKLTNQKSLLKEGILDGITIYFRFKNDSVDNHFSFICPDPSDSAEFKIIKSLFNLFENSFKNHLSINYIEHLKGYFDFGLLVKHISDNPLEYRFYDHLSANEYDEFYELMESLPIDKPIIFDFSNFSGMGTMFYDDFEDLIDENPNIYWLVNEFSMRQIKEIGVRKNRIFLNRENLLKKIKKHTITGRYM